MGQYQMVQHICNWTPRKKKRRKKRKEKEREKKRIVSMATVTPRPSGSIWPANPTRGENRNTKDKLPFMKVEETEMSLTYFFSRVLLYRTRACREEHSRTQLSPAHAGSCCQVCVNRYCVVHFNTRFIHIPA